MDPTFLGVPGVDGWTFAALAIAPMLTNFFGVTMGAAGGLLLLAFMALFLPPAVLIPVHTVVQLGSVTTRTMMMWRWIMAGMLPPFLLGAVLGAAAGARIFVSLPSVALQGILGVFILVVAWLPRLARAGGEKRRFALAGFGVTFLGVFVSATGTLLMPFVAAASPNRHNFAATASAMMFILHACKLTAFLAVGIAIGAYVPLIAAMIAFSALGNWMGRQTLERMPERLFRILLKTVLTVLSLRLIWVAAHSAGWV